MNRNTISRQITTTEENIRRLMEDLENTESRNAEFANCQNKVDKLFGKLSESNSELTADVKEMLKNLKAGKVTPDAFEKLLLREREKVSFTLNLADEAKRRLEEVMTFVQHFVTDVEKGKTIPKGSFKSMYHELDTVTESMNSMAKVHRSNDIEKLRKIMTIHFEEQRDMFANNGVVSLKTILAENNREAKERLQKERQAAGNRTSVVGIGSLARPRSQQGLLERQSSGGKLTNLDMSELSPTRLGSPPSLHRGGTGNSLSSRGPGSPTKGGFGVERQFSGDDLEAEKFALHGRPSTISVSSKKKGKKEGKKEKRLSSAVIYSHTEDDANSIGSGTSQSLANPLSITQYVPTEPKKLLLTQGTQTDDVDITSVEKKDTASDNNNRNDVKEQRNKSAGTKRSGGLKRKAGGGRRSPVPSASTRHHSPMRGRGVERRDQNHSTNSQNLAQDSSRYEKTKQDNITAEKYLNKYADEAPTSSGHNEVGADMNDDLSSAYGEENTKNDDVDYLRNCLKEKEERLLLLEAKLQKQETDMAAHIEAEVIIEVEKRKKNSQSNADNLA